MGRKEGNREERLMTLSSRARLQAGSMLRPRPGPDTGTQEELSKWWLNSAASTVDQAECQMLGSQR